MPDTMPQDLITPYKTIRVILADDHAIVRTGLKAVLASAPDIEVIGEASTGHEALVMATHFQPDVILMDLSMPALDGTAATSAIKELGLPTRVLILTMHEEEEYLIPLLEAGASGYLMKSLADRELVSAVRAVAQGDTYVQPSAARVLARRFSEKDPIREARERFQLLTQRERDILRLFAQGYSGPEVGERLNISAKTVETYKHRVQEKLGFTHRADYIQFALKLGLLGTD